MWFFFCFVFVRCRFSALNGSGIFFRRKDFSAFNILPRHKLNSYHVKVRYTRCFFFLTICIRSCASELLRRGIFSITIVDLTDDEMVVAKSSEKSNDFGNLGRILSMVVIV